MLKYGRVLVGDRYKKYLNISTITTCVLLMFAFWELCYYLYYGTSPLGFRVHILYVVISLVAIWDHSLSLYRFKMYGLRYEYKFYPKIQPVSEDIDEVLGEVLLREECDGSCKLIVAVIKNSSELRQRMKNKSYVMVRFENDCFDLEECPRSIKRNVELI
ncbi:MAG: hypothetical protein IJX20_02345 [Alphaproteobacteria bacterium]|nr:hypothetical protein [Alphaproteobacteria bacterium]